MDIFDKAKHDEKSRKEQQDNMKDAQKVAQDKYSKLKADREKATFAMMMRMSPDVMTNIRNEFFAKEDILTLHEFIAVVQKHMTQPMGYKEKREFTMQMYEIFKDIDVNGDGNLEWQEFTAYVVEKSSLLNNHSQRSNIPQYFDSSMKLNFSSRARRQRDIFKFAGIPTLHQFAVVENDHKAIYMYNSRSGEYVKTIDTESPPVALEYVSHKDLLAVSCSDMTLSTYVVEDPNPKKKYILHNSWSVDCVQMAMSYGASQRKLYSGGTNGLIYSWDISHRQLLATIPAHEDIIMSLITMKNLNNLASGSLDKCINLWDSQTSEKISQLRGHKKGVLAMSFSAEYRMLFSTGFEHDCLVWSPFVNSLLFRLQGHHASLIGVQAIEGTPEVVTADSAGVIKLWDIRNFGCVQTFNASYSGESIESATPKFNCFLQMNLPTATRLQEEDDVRIFIASRRIQSFDQSRIVQHATTDSGPVLWVFWDRSTSNFITVSEYSITVWDGLIGSKVVRHKKVSAEEITACCLDHRARKIILGDITGAINVFNKSSGSKMKSVFKSLPEAVLGLEYLGTFKWFVAAYSGGIVRIYDDNPLEECLLVKGFDAFYSNQLLKCTSFNPFDNSIVMTGEDGKLKIYDFIRLKCVYDAKVCLSTDVIVSARHLGPYPLFATADSKGNIAIWGSVGSTLMGKRLSGFCNVAPVEAYQERYDVSFGETFFRVLPSPDAVLSRQDTEKDTDNIVFFDMQKQDQIDTAVSKAKEDRPAVEENIICITADEDPIGYYYAMAEAKWGPIMAAQAIAFDPITKLFFTGDYLGSLRCFSLETLIDDFGGHSVLMSGRARLSKKWSISSPRRGSVSALPPRQSQIKKLLASKKNDPFLGVEFVWSLQGHKAGIVTIATTEHGVVSSGADCLVRMWSYEGIFIGTLVQTVPSGVRNASWNLRINTYDLMKEEDDILDDILEVVEEVLDRKSSEVVSDATGRGMDFLASVGHGAKQNFSQSFLRQRLYRSKDILAIDFDINPPNATSPSRLDRRISLKRSSSHFHSSKLLASTASKVIDDSLLKSTKAALAEAKSAKVVHQESSRKIGNDMQIRIRANKLEALSNRFAESAGVKVATKSGKGRQRGRASQMNEDDIKMMYDVMSSSEENTISSSAQNMSISRPRNSVEHLQSLQAGGKVSETSVMERARLERRLSRFDSYKGLELALSDGSSKVKCKTSAALKNSSDHLNETQKAELARIKQAHKNIICGNTVASISKPALKIFVGQDNDTPTMILETPKSLDAEMSTAGIDSKLSASIVGETLNPSGDGDQASAFGD